MFQKLVSLMKIDGKEKRRQYYITAPIFPLLIKTAIPTMIGMLVSVVYNLTDTFWVGRLNDKSMTAAIGVVFAFSSIIQAIGFWFGYGSGNTMSRFIGAKDEEGTRKIAADANIMAVIAGIVILLLGFIFIDPLLYLLGANASENLLKFSKDYLRVILFAVPFNIFSVTVYNQLRLCGSVKDAMTGLLVGMLSNILLDPIFVTGLQMGIIGAGIATLIGNLASTVVLIGLSCTHDNIPVSFRFYGIDSKRIYHILMGGMPNFSRQGITGISSMLLNNVATFYGEELIAAFTVASRIITFGYMLMIGLGQGFQPICAMNYGSKNYTRVKTALKQTVVLGTGFLIASSVAIFVFSNELCACLIDDGTVIDTASQILRYQCITMPALGVYALSSMFLQNTGFYKKALLISVSRQGIFFIPLLYILSYAFGRYGFVILQPAADILSVLFGVFIVVKNWNSIFEVGE